MAIPGKLGVGLLAGLVAVAALAGCQRRIYFTPVEGKVGPNANLMERSRYVLAASKGQAATATLAAQGMLGKRKGDPQEQADTITVIFTVRNPLAEPVAAAVKNFYLLDDEDVKIDGPQVYSHQELTGDDWTVGPEQSNRAILTFALPPDVSLKKMGSFRLFWSAKVGAGKPESFQTRFIRSAEPEVYYAQPYPPYYYGYGGYPPYWGYPYSYSYPYGGPYGYGFYFGGGGFGGRFGGGHEEHEHHRR